MACGHGSCHTPKYLVVVVCSPMANPEQQATLLFGKFADTQNKSCTTPALALAQSLPPREQKGRELYLAVLGQRASEQPAQCSQPYERLSRLFDVCVSVWWVHFYFWDPEGFRGVGCC